MSKAKFRSVVNVEADEYDLMQSLVTRQGSDYPKNQFVFYQSAVFPLGMTMLIQVLTTSEPQEDTCRTQGVLYRFERQPDGLYRGDAVGRVDGGSSFGGEYAVEYEGNEYIAVVQRSSTVTGGNK
jgi:hypothetical protein